MSRTNQSLYFHGMAIIGISFLFLLSLGSSTVMGQVTQFTAIDVTCEVVNEGVTTVGDDGTTYVEGQISKGVLMSDNPLIAGTSYIVVDSVVPPGSDVTQLSVVAIYYPETVRGAWAAPGQGQVGPDGLLVRHNGSGTRGLHDSFIAFEIRGAEVDPATLPCEPVIPPAQLTGVIIGGSE